ncbi:MAG: hypothetical protein JWO95_2638 [Verrucomicrobiales bacterium]|nr:hypothetical protein [Verrucomicrobiales bacterium]
MLIRFIGVSKIAFRRLPAGICHLAAGRVYCEVASFVNIVAWPQKDRERMTDFNYEKRETHENGCTAWGRPTQLRKLKNRIPKPMLNEHRQWDAFENRALYSKPFERLLDLVICQTSTWRLRPTTMRYKASRIIAPTMDARKPAESPSLYQPTARPI